KGISEELDCRITCTKLKKLQKPGTARPTAFARRGTPTTADVHRSQTQTPPDVILSAGSVLLCKTESSEGYMHSRRYYYVYIMTNRSRTLHRDNQQSQQARVPAQDRRVSRIYFPLPDCPPRPLIALHRR